MGTSRKFLGTLKCLFLYYRKFLRISYNIKTLRYGCAARGEVIMLTQPLAREVPQAALCSFGNRDKDKLISK